MKRKKNTQFFIVVALVFTMALGNVSVSAAAPKLSKTKVTLLKGEKITLKVTGTQKEGNMEFLKEKYCNSYQ